MKLEDLGYNAQFAKFRVDNNLGNFEIGRVVVEHKERYIIWSSLGELEAEITGNLRFSAKSREDFPAVGDWVAISIYDNSFAIIHGIYPRASMLKRKAVGQFGEVQVIASNIDFAFLVQSVDRDFNINRLERYLTICYTADVKPIIVLTKTDLIPRQEVEQLINLIHDRIKDVPVISISNLSSDDIVKIHQVIIKGKTYCLLGSSGVGKSTLLNNLIGSSVMQSGSISSSTNRGRHITSHREMFMLENGGLIIDNPGMREIGITDSNEGLEATFDSIFQLSLSCKFKDCTHTKEIGCAVIDSLEKGELDQSTYENYIKMQRERAFFESTVEERKKREREFGKIMKNYKKTIKKNSQDR